LEEGIVRLCGVEVERAGTPVRGRKDARWSLKARGRLLSRVIRVSTEREADGKNSTTGCRKDTLALR